MARIKIYDNNKKEWVYADKSFSKSSTTEIISLSDYGFVLSSVDTQSYETIIATGISNSLRNDGLGQMAYGYDKDGRLFSAIANNITNNCMFSANLYGGITLLRPEMLLISDDELRLSFSSIFYTGRGTDGYSNIYIHLELNSDTSATVYVSTDSIEVVNGPS